MLGASPNEVALVAFVLVLVLLAPKVPRIGEVLGAWIERGLGGPPGGRGTGSGGGA